MSRLRTYNLLRGAAGWRTAGGSRDTLQADVDAVLDHYGGLDLYHRDDAWRTNVIAHFEFNIRRMMRAAKGAGVPIIVVNPVSNLRDCPPFKSEHSPGLSAEAIAGVAQRRAEAARLPIDQIDRRVELLRRAVERDPRNAALHYELAVALDLAGEAESAAEAYRRALEEDTCPLRMLERMHRRLERIVEEEGGEWLDFRADLTIRARGPVPGDDLLLDHVHPRIEEHRRLAEMLLERMERMSLVTPAAGWRQRRDVLHERHRQGLPFGYFQRGKERLEGLRLWTQGRAGGEAAAERAASESDSSSDFDSIPPPSSSEDSNAS